MAQKANILSFDEVKARGAFAPRTVSSKRSSRSSRFAGNSYSGAHAEHRTPSHARHEAFSNTAAPRHSYRGEMASRTDRSRSASSLNPTGVAEFDPAFSRRSARNDEGYHAPSRRFRDSGLTEGRRGTRASFSEDQMREDELSSPRSSGHAYEHPGFIERITKQFRSAKAEKAFNKTIGARDRKQQAEQGSRPALYEMKMGATHRKSARMQDSDTARKKSGFSLPFAIPFSGSLSAAATRGIVALAVVGLTVFMLYPSCQNYYNETRQLQQLQAEYEALEDYNNQMQSQVNYLNTDEGLEDYARSELGWIREDEHLVTVEGVESSVDSTGQSSTTHSPLNEKIPAPSTWYSGVLDFFFGYKS